MSTHHLPFTLSFVTFDMSDHYEFDCSTYKEAYELLQSYREEGLVAEALITNQGGVRFRYSAD